MTGQEIYGGFCTGEGWRLGTRRRLDGYKEGRKAWEEEGGNLLCSARDIPLSFRAFGVLMS